MISAKSAASAALPALLLVLLTVILYFVTYQSVSAAIISIVAWNVIVKTLELNDFRHRIKKSSLRGSRYIAALVATRLGLRDAIRDWCIIYSILYAIVAGITWKDADPNSLLVLWGAGVMIAALILAILGLKVPHWVCIMFILEFIFTAAFSGIIFSPYIHSKFDFYDVVIAWSLPQIWTSNYQ